MSGIFLRRLSRDGATEGAYLGTGSVVCSGQSEVARITVFDLSLNMVAPIDSRSSRSGTDTVLIVRALLSASSAHASVE